MKIKFAVLQTIGNFERIENVRRMKKQIPELEVIPADKSDVFEKHIELFNLSDDFDGIVILEDDVKLCRDFKKRLQKVLEVHTNEVVSLFESPCSKKHLQSEYRNGGRFLYCVCNYYPKNACEKLFDLSLVEEFTDWFYATKNEPWNYPIDTYIAYALKKHKMRYWMQVPFLVQHLDFKSNFKGRSTSRQTKFFIDDIE